MKRRVKQISALLLSIIMVFAMATLSGCFDFFVVKLTDIAFTDSELEFTLGDKVELNRYMQFTPAKASNRKFTVVSSDSDVITIDEVVSDKVSHVYAQAVGVGKATLTVVADADETLTDTVTVTVSYAQPSQIRIEACDWYTTVGDTVIIQKDEIAPLTFKATLGANVDPQYGVLWSVTGGYTYAGALPASQSVTFTPKGVGQSIVTASVTDDEGIVYRDTVKVNVCDDVVGAQITYSGEQQQKAGACSTVLFSMVYDEMPEGNPDPIIEWRVNGATQGYGTQFGFLPTSVGLYNIEGYVNGKAVSTVSGDASVAVYVRGTIVPQNVWVDYDNCYPKVIVRWDEVAAAGFALSIIDTATGHEIASDLNSRNLGLKNAFTNGSFDATQYLSGKVNLFNTRLAVRVKTLRDEDGIFDESDWSKTCTTQLLPARAKSYLADSFYDGARNRYIVSRDEFREWFEYAMLWRPSLLAAGGEKLYLAYKFTSAMNEIEYMMNTLHFTGSYTYSGAESDVFDNECTFKITFKTVGAPSTRTSVHSGEAWKAMRPHINYDLTKARSSRYEFAIDRRTPVTVTTSDQLYYIAQLGYSPVPSAGSVAEKLYNYARRTLRYIVTDEMSDVEKAHAIYDWIMWRVVYDNEVLDISSLSNSVRYESYYLESVFTDSAYYGVCDAMSKAYSLLCNMEGIDCVRVTGTARSGNSSGGHAWNKVKIEGKWYAVDCTWGDASVQIMANGAFRESAGHAYFLVSDTDIADTHTEDENSNYPVTAATRYPWYAQEITYNNTTVSLYPGSAGTTTALKNDLSALVSYMVDSFESATQVYRVGADSVNQVTSPYYACEFAVDSKWNKTSGSIFGGLSNSTLRSTLTSELTKHRYALNSDYYLVTSEMGNKTFVMVFFRFKA